MTTRRSPVERIEKLANLPMRRLLLLGVAPRAFALVETTGRRTGASRLTPVGNGLDGDVFWLVAGRGHGCGYVANLMANPACRVRVKRQWRAGTASAVVDDDSFSRRRRIDLANGMIGRLDGVLFRKAASDPITLRIDLS